MLGSVAMLPGLRELVSVAVMSCDNTCSDKGSGRCMSDTRSHGIGLMPRMIDMWTCTGVAADRGRRAIACINVNYPQIRYLDNWEAAPGPQG